MIDKNEKNPRAKIAAICAIILVIIGSLVFATRYFYLPVNYSVNVRALVAKHGGVDQLRSECAQIAGPYEGMFFSLVFPTNLPSMLQKINPKMVYLDDEDYVNVALSGGFFHHGLLVSLDVTNAKCAGEFVG